MKKSIFTIAIILSIVSAAFISCSSDDDHIGDDNNGNSSTSSSYTFTIDGVTASEFNGEIIMCPDGFLTLNGKAPDGSILTIQSGKILVNETRSFCDIRPMEDDEFLACMADNGFSISGLFMQENFTSGSGTVTRTSTNNLEMSGTIWYINSPQISHEFTLKVTAGLISPINCE